MAKKLCNICKTEKEHSEFYTNRTKSDGLQSYCKQCNKVAYGKWFKCSSCGLDFYINHRNVSQRKTTLCKECVKPYVAKIITLRNKERATGITYHDKGYQYVWDPTSPHKYKFAHRKIMEEYIGRKLTTEEVIHHIDGDKLNNKLENLVLATKRDHGLMHGSLERIAFFLVKSSKICFNRETKEYELIEESNV